ncbi:zinc ABC transporter substrate-binding protein [Sulfitobacter aestuarii]|uniref:High-affinity zinc uptake system protein ZnuA n=1 Tax=Sulfitobacter aestuarii TaxID=2161676 RepID=A0ABW5U2W3_9RHOB
MFTLSKILTGATALTLLSVKAEAQVPQVATDIAPVQSLVAQVMGELGTPDLVIPANASPHGYAMRPSEARSLAGADLVVWIGPELTPWLAEPIDTLAGEAAQLGLMAQPGTQVLTFRDGAGFGAHAAHGVTVPEAQNEAGHDEEEHDVAHDHDGHGHDGIDPHGWLDPRNAALWLGVIADELSRLDPDNSETYRGNAAAAQEALAVLEAEIAADLAPHGSVPFVVFHDGYHYFEDRFGLQPLAAITAGDAARPGAARISALRAEIAAAAPRCAFSEPQMNSALLETVVAGQAVNIGKLDPLGARLTPGAALYPELLRAMAAAMAECLSD